MIRYTTGQYAQALLGAVEGKSAVLRNRVFRNFFILLRKNRDTARLSAILREAERSALSKMGIKKVEVESAAGLGAFLKREISRLAGGKIYFKESVKPELLGGLAILIDEEILIDASVKRRLEVMFSGNATN
jgi:F0F1-type ATP synthase delta subunit